MRIGGLYQLRAENLRSQRRSIPNCSLLGCERVGFRFSTESGKRCVLGGGEGCSVETSPRRGHAARAPARTKTNKTNLPKCHR